MANAGASSSKNSNSNIDDQQRDVVGGPVYKKVIRKKQLTKKNLGLSIGSINKFNYHFGGKI